MSKNQGDADALKPIFIKLLEDEEMLNSIRGALCRMLGCVAAVPVVQDEPGGEHESAQGGKGKCRETEERLHKVERELADKNRQIDALELNNSQLKQDADHLRSQLTQAEQAQNRALADLKSVRQAHEDLQEENTQLKQRSPLPPTLASVLSQVRSDDELVKRLELNTNLDDTAMLVQTVAVLSQESNIKRLWDIYKSRCESRKAAISAQERAVFETALEWLNSNRPNKPHQISEPEIGSLYDYNKNIRAPAMGGDKITAVWLPGVPAMKLLPLVATG